MKIRLLKTGQIVDAIGPNENKVYCYLSGSGYFINVYEVETELVEDVPRGTSEQKLTQVQQHLLENKMQDFAEALKTVALMQPKKFTMEF